MPERITAGEKLQRLLYVLPAAARPGGARLDELAHRLDTTVAQLVADLGEVTDRVYYHPGAWPDDIQILIDADRVRVVIDGGFTRPPRLSALETLCLALALRGGASASQLQVQEDRSALLERAEKHLGRRSAGPDPDTIRIDDHRPDPSGVREELMTGARERRSCAIVYLKPGGEGTEERIIHPYTMAMGEGFWYVVAYCTTRSDVRVFRTDRVLAARLESTPFTVPESFDATRYVDGGRIFFAPGAAEARVRYSSRVARWIRERAHYDGVRLTEAGDGSVVASHPVADPQWLLARVLQYGPDAEILHPPELRELVRERLGALHP
ncbi:MAG: WYL domain-containing protein [Gemmatimonadota bacterium]|nr:WYL domain-containing protein [Gemmatimonadota bacterium]MDH5759054.1 WYL domain-containing protein [Gemmatimonadota bacterium]